MHRVTSSVVAPISLEEAWDFFATPNNLEKLTPAKMGMQMVDGAIGEMYPGMIIRYRVAPIAGIKMSWSSEITQVKKGHYFVDSMLEGPFAVWHHQHFFKEVPGGTEISDLLHYKVPLGFLGELFHPLLVKKNVQEIFDYREVRIRELFGS